MKNLKHLTLVPGSPQCCLNIHTQGIVKPCWQWVTAEGSSEGPTSAPPTTLCPNTHTHTAFSKDPLCSVVFSGGNTLFMSLWGIERSDHLIIHKTNYKLPTTNAHTHTY